jgi:hypothetical protein
MKLYDLFEGYYDPPEYPDSSGMGFYDDELDDVEDQFDLLLWDKKTGLFIVRNKQTKIKYLSHTDMVDIDYYMADMYPEEDEDEDGRYTYNRLDKDNAEMVEESLTMFATIAMEEGDVGKDYDEWETGVSLIEYGRIIIRGLYINEKDVFNSLMDIIKQSKRTNFKL